MSWVFWVLVCFALLFSMWALPQMDCDKKGELMRFQSRYEFPGGCFLLVEGRWVPLDSYRVVE